MHLGLRRKAPSHALTASATRADVNNSASMRRLVQPWQERALTYYDSLGAIKYAGNFLSRNLTQLRIFPAFLDENGEPQETELPAARELLDRVQDPNGGRTNLFGTYARLRFLIGESYLVCTYDGDDGEKWEMLSVDELRVNASGTYTRMMAPQTGTTELKAAPDDAFEPLADTAIVYRLWRPHPRFSLWADSSLRGILDDCEELLLLQAAVRARVRSRLAGPGVWVIADDISPAPPEVIGDENMAADPFYEDLIEAITTPISEEGSAAAMVPMLLRVPAERVKDGFNFISFRDANEEYREVALRDEALKRLAIGLDMPPEVLTGIADVNHWGAWQVDEQTFKAHIQPVCQELCDDLTSAYLRPAAREAGIANWQRIVVAYDAAGIVNHPDRAKDAKELQALGAIGHAALRDACGFDDSDAPTEAERAERIGILTRDPSLAWYGIPTIRSGGIEPSPGEIEDPQGSNDAGAGPSTGAEVEPGPPPNAPPDTNVASAMILGACDMAVERSRSLAGSRIRTRANNGCQECKERLLQVPQRLVASTLGPEMVSGLNAPADRELVAGGADDLVQTLTRWGIAGERARAIGDQVESHAARTLYELEPAPLPSGFAAFVARLSGPVAVAA
jgi:hypothetical protein